MRSLRRHDEHGFSLVELLVVIALLSTVGLVVVGGMSSGLRAGATVSDQTKTNQQMQTALDQVTKVLRQAQPVYATGIGPRQVAVRTYGNGSCTRTEFKVEGTDLVQYTQALGPNPPAFGSATPSTASCTGTTGSPSTKVLLRGVSGTETLFSYWNDRETSGPRQLSLVAPGTDTPSQISSIVVTLTRPASGRAKALTLTTRVNIRNYANTGTL